MGGKTAARAPADAAAEQAANDPVVTDYLQHLRTERRVAERTLTLYTDALVRLQQHVAKAGIALSELQPHQLRRIVGSLHAQGLGPRSLALHLSAWRGFYRWWGRKGGVALNPADGLRAPKAARPLPSALPVDQAMALASHEPAGDDALAARDRCVVEVLYGCGLRISELVGLDVRAGADAAGWIDISDATAHVLGKGSKRRSVPVGRMALAALQDWLAQRALMARADEPALFVSQRGTRLSAAQIRLRLKAQAVQAGVPTSVYPHMLRHSYASHLLQSSGDLRAVQELLGHANISTTQVYTRLDFQHLARVYDAAHPRAKKRS